jgi:hypothetical protein
LEAVAVAAGGIGLTAEVGGLASRLNHALAGVVMGVGGGRWNRWWFAELLRSRD